MSSTTSYSVNSTGCILPDFSLDSVKSEFGSLFGISAEKAAAYTDTQKLIKKGLSEHDAEAYRTRLEAIGLDVVIHAHSPGSDAPMVVEPKMSMDALSLLPTGDETEATVDTAPQAPKGFCCPKCELEQERSDECIGCGIIFSKYQRAVVESEAGVVAGSASSDSTETGSARARTSVVRKEEQSGLNIVSIIVLIAVMIACAFLWKFIAMSMDRELGLIAWAIGGAIGAAAVGSGARGDGPAFACAVLVVMAIFGGKYLYMSSYQQDFADLFNDESSLEMQSYMDAIRVEALIFEETGRDDASVKQFMVDHDYTDASTHLLVTNQELEEFQEYIQPMLERGLDTDMNAAQFLDEAAPELGAAMNESVWSWVFESLGLIDMLFLLLGCGTAFRMVRESS